jgi:nucleoside-diphosphate-sugar epimerase
MSEKTLTICSGVHDFVYIDDFIRALRTIAFSLSAGCGEIINIGTGVMNENEDVVKCFERILNKKIDYVRTNDRMREYDGTMWRCDISHAKNKYQFQCKYDLVGGIMEYVFHRRK